MPRGPIGPAERQYRLAVLADIERRVAEDGPRIARPDPMRARQFMPFAALKGYGGLIAECEEDDAD